MPGTPKISTSLENRASAAGDPGDGRGVIVASVPYFNARALFYHVCVPAGEKPANAAGTRPRTVAQSAEGQMTTLCEFYTRDAQWRPKPLTGYVPCTVCAARAGGSFRRTFSASGAKDAEEAAS